MPNQTNSPYGYYSTQSLLWLATHNPSTLFWTSTRPAGTPASSLYLEFPVLFTKSITRYRAAKAPLNAPPVLIKAGHLAEVVDAYAPTFTTQSLQASWVQCQHTIAQLNYPSLTTQPTQVHEMTHRSIVHSISWTQIWNLLMKDLASLAISALNGSPPVFPGKANSSSKVYVHYIASKNSPETTFALCLSHVSIPVSVSSAPTRSPTEFGSLLFQLPPAHTLKDCDWDNLQQFFLNLQQELKAKHIGCVLPF